MPNVTRIPLLPEWYTSLSGRIIARKVVDGSGGGTGVTVYVGSSAYGAGFSDLISSCSSTGISAGIGAS